MSSSSLRSYTQDEPNDGRGFGRCGRSQTNIKYRIMNKESRSEHVPTAGHCATGPPGWPRCGWRPGLIHGRRIRGWRLVAQPLDNGATGCGDPGGVPPVLLAAAVELHPENGRISVTSRFLVRFSFDIPSCKLFTSHSTPLRFDRLPNDDSILGAVGRFFSAFLLLRNGQIVTVQTSLAACGRKMPRIYLLSGAPPRTLLGKHPCMARDTLLQ